eukprot:TRINITY_DN38297_c0_g1_i3.p1 TRINITY_DN38297_c0_g1~~TRINITY_DN38297_c0_g1_i3.p1  ORF type:complete len:170 (+),score=47.49 TRINITY_DN38297_c0_g1_i3:89-598(+)
MRGLSCSAAAAHLSGLTCVPTSFDGSDEEVKFNANVINMVHDSEGWQFPPPARREVDMLEILGEERAPSFAKLQRKVEAAQSRLDELDTALDAASDNVQKTMTLSSLPEPQALATYLELLARRRQPAPQMGRRRLHGRLQCPGTQQRRCSTGGPDAVLAPASSLAADFL